MAERFKSPEPRSGNERLRSVAEARKKYFDKLAKSPWSWAAAAVMALETQGCATMSQAVGYLTLEPRSGGMKYDSNVGQTGNFVGPTLKLESAPERPRAGIANLPEGYYLPDLAERLHAARARGGRAPDVPSGFIDLESLGYERGNEAFIIVQESHRGAPKTGAERGSFIAQEVARGVSLMQAMPRSLDDGVRMEWTEVTRYSSGADMIPPPAVNVEERASNIASAVSSTAVAEKITDRKKQAEEKERYIVPIPGGIPSGGFAPYRGEPGVLVPGINRGFRTRVEPRPGEPTVSSDYFAGDTRTSLSCRMTNISGNLREAKGPARRTSATALEYDILRGDLSLHPLRLVTSRENSREYPERPAQAALATPYEKVADLTILYTAYEILTSQEDSLRQRMDTLEQRIPTLQGEEKMKAEAQYGRLSRQLSRLRVSDEYRQTEDRFRSQLTALRTELTSLRSKPLPAKEKYDVDDLREGAAEKKRREKRIPELEAEIARLEHDMTTELERLTPTSLNPLTKKLSSLLEPIKQQLMAAAMGALAGHIASHTQVRIFTDIDATRGGIRLVVIIDNPKK